MENLGSIGLSEEQTDLIEAAMRFCREKSSTAAARLLLDDDIGFDCALWNEIAELGWLGIAIPKEFGGSGLGLAEVTPVMEQMGRHFLCSPFYATTLAAQAVIVAGTEPHKKHILPKIAEGRAASLALAEPHGDWDVNHIECAARQDGDDMVLSGTKRFVLDAFAARWIIASVQYDKSPALILISKSLLTQENCRREIIIDETKRSYELRLDGMRIPASAMLDQDKTHAALKHIELCALLLTAAEIVGGTCSVIDYTLEYLKTRKQFGRLIGSYQSLKHPTVDAFIEYEQARSHLYAAAHSFKEQGTGEIATRMAKAQAEKVYAFASDRSIQFHGGFGFTYDCDAHLHRRRAIWHASQFGDVRYQRKRLAELLF